MWLVAVKRPIRLPRSVEPHRAQVEHGLRAGCGPAHPGWFQAIVHQMPTGPFDDSRANRPALCPGFVVVPRWAVAPIRADRTSYGLPWGRRARGSAGVRFQGREHRLGLSGHEGLQVAAHPRGAVGMGAYAPG